MELKNFKRFWLLLNTIEQLSFFCKIGYQLSAVNYFRLKYHHDIWLGFEHASGSMID